MSEYQGEIDYVYRFIVGHPRCNTGDMARFTGIDIRLIRQIVDVLTKSHLIESATEHPRTYRSVQYN